MLPEVEIHAPQNTGDTMRLDKDQEGADIADERATAWPMQTDHVPHELPHEACSTRRHRGRSLWLHYMEMTS